MLDGWSIAIETTGGIVGLETCWSGEALGLLYPDGANISNEIITKILGTTSMDEQVCITCHKAYYTDDLRIISNGEICRANNNNPDIIHAYVPNRDSTKSLNRSELIKPFQNKFIELLVKIATEIGDITAIDLDSGVFCLYSAKTFADNGYKLTKKKDPSGEPYYYYTNSSSGIELMFEFDDDSVLDMTSTIIRCPANNTLTAEILIQLINKLDNGNGSCSPLTFALFREIAKT